MARIIIFILLLFPCDGYSQEDVSFPGKLIAAPDKLFKTLDRNTRRMEERLDRQTNVYLDKLARQEKKLQKKLAKKDSILAKSLFAGIDQQYARLKDPSGISARVYSGRLDSLTTALNFLKKNNIGGLSDNPSLQGALQQFKGLQEKINNAADVNKYLAQRQQVLKEQLQRLGMVKELRQYREQAYYYKEQVREYQSRWEDPDKMMATLMDVLTRLPAFNSFFARNSILGSIFSLPGSNEIAAASLQEGLQTTNAVSQMLMSRYGSGPQAMQAFQQNISFGQDELSRLKNKINQLGNGSGSDADMPNFRPNAEKVKTFLQRLEYSANLQSQHGSNYFPATTTVALSLAYRLSDKKDIGIGMGEIIGLGSGWNHIRFTQSGVNLRSFIDWRIKMSSLWLTGGYEMNYLSAFNSIEQLQQYNAWRRSGLIGISKKYSVGKI